MKKGRSKDHVWQFCKFKGDIAYYAKCKCGFRYACYKHKKIGEVSPVPDPERLYNYCPFCGARKTRYNTEIIYIDKFPWEN